MAAVKYAQNSKEGRVQGMGAAASSKQTVDMSPFCQSPRNPWGELSRARHFHSQNVGRTLGIVPTKPQSRTGIDMGSGA
ncbi:hypothetical protein SUNI508_05746 [Seiridium unicorne]|uniref:Uncharacterized protein n=1 Tax=Seiridium unicorne TaxID=138068 RepID=A0ABR2V4R9_9PEZI